MLNNAFFKASDPKAAEISGMAIPDSWWSRGFEYHWAMLFAKPGQVVADMGCGWHERPLKHSLSDVCQKVYAVDAHPGLFDLRNERPFPDNMTAIVEDMTEVDLPPLDRIFCVSVLEDLGHMKLEALKHFKELLKPDGLIVLTFDSQYDMGRPLGKYPGVEIEAMAEAIYASGLKRVGDVDTSKEDALFHYDFNLAVYHTILAHEDA